MPFDIAGARQAGYSDAEITGFLTQTKGATDFNVSGALQAGYSPTEVIDHLAPRNEFADKVNGFTAKVGRFASKVMADPPPTIESLRDMPREAIQEAGKLQRTGDAYNAGPALSAATLTMGNVPGPKRMGAAREPSPSAKLADDAAAMHDTVAAEVAQHAPPPPAQPAPQPTAPGGPPPMQRGDVIGNPKVPAAPATPVQQPAAVRIADALDTNPANAAEFIPGIGGLIAKARAAARLAQNLPGQGRVAADARAPWEAPQVTFEGKPWQGAGSVKDAGPRPINVKDDLVARLNDKEGIERIDSEAAVPNMVRDLNAADSSPRRMPQEAPPPVDVKALLARLNASDNHFDPTLGKADVPGLPAVIRKPSPIGNVNTALSPDVINMPQGPQPLALPRPGGVIQMPAPAPQLALPKPTAPVGQPALPPGFSPEKLQQLLAMQRQNMQGRTPEAPIRPQPVAAPPAPVSTASSFVPNKEWQEPPRGWSVSQAVGEGNAIEMKSEGGKILVRNASTGSPPPVATPEPALVAKALAKVTKRTPEEGKPKVTVEKVAENKPAIDAKPADKPVAAASDFPDMPDFLKRDKGSASPVADTSVKPVATPPDLKALLNASLAVEKAKKLTPIEELESRAKPSRQSRRVREEMGEVSTDPDLIAAQKAMAKVQALRAAKKAAVAEPKQTQKAYEAGLASGKEGTANPSEPAWVRTDKALQTEWSRGVADGLPKKPQAKAPEPALSKATKSADARRARLKEVQDGANTVSSRDNERSIDLMQHTASGMDAEAAAADIADNMAAMGKPVRDRGDFISYVAAITEARDAMATKMARALKIEPSHLIDHMRAVPSQSEALRWRSELQAHEPTQAGEVEKIMPDKLIKKLWKKK